MKRTGLIGVALAVSMALAGAAAYGQSASMDHGRMHGMGHGGGHGMGQSMGHGMMRGTGQGMGGAGAGGRAPMRGMVGMLTTQDAGSSADMDVVHDLLMSHQSIRRTVTRLPDGIRTVTESNDPAVANAIKAHVASMSQRLAEGREFNIFSTTLPVIFEHRDTIRSEVVTTATGVIVTRTSSNPKVVAALQGHADEVTELAQQGMVAMRRGMMSRMAMGGPRGPRGAAPAAPAR
jgi:hypothetical protein